MNWRIEEFFILFLITRKTTKIRRPLLTMSTDTKLSEAQISKIIQLGESLGS